MVKKAERKARAEWEEAQAKLDREKHGHDLFVGIFCYRCNKGHIKKWCKEKKMAKKVKLFRTGLMCFKCKEEGHFLNNCPKLKKKFIEPIEPGVPRVKMVICYHCKEPGHIARECTERQKRRQAAVRAARAKTVTMIGVDGRTTCYCKNCEKWRHLDIDCPMPLEEVSAREDIVEETPSPKAADGRECPEETER